MENLELSTKKAEEAHKKQAEDNKKQMDDVMNSNKKLTDLMMSRFAEIDSKTPAGITKRISRSKSKTRSPTTIERRDELARKTLFGGVPINQFEVGDSSSASKHGFMTPRKCDHKTNNNILHPMDDAEEKPCNVLGPF
jgi:hypothetical protein